MSLGNNIAYYRKKINMTQEALAQKLAVTNQAVSKWELNQCCPDVTLLPLIADIFGVSIDALFGREPEKQPTGETVPDRLPWKDDTTLRVVLYIGHKLMACGPATKGYEYACEMPVDRVISDATIKVGDVGGDVSCGMNLTCEDVQGNVSAGATVNCGTVQGNVDAGATVNCGNIEGDVDAGAMVNCGNVSGSVDAGGDVNCGNVNGDVDAGLNVKCGDVGGDVDAGCSVECAAVGGDIDAGGNVTVRGKDNGEWNHFMS